MKKWEVSRRACLRGGGAAVGLPLLEAMLPGVQRARAAGASAPKRLVFFVFANGTSDTSLTKHVDRSVEGKPGTFWPKTLGTGFEPTPILQPLIDLGLRNEIMVIRDLENDTFGFELAHYACISLMTGGRVLNPSEPEIGRAHV